MQKQFFSHLIIIVGLNLIVKPFAIFGIDAQVQNLIGPSEYGMYFALLNFSYLFNIALDLGITNFNIKNLASHPHLANTYFGKIIPIRLLLLVLYVFLTICIALILNYSVEQFKILSILILNQFIISFILYVRSYFSGLLLLKLESVFSVLDKFLLIIFMLYLFNQAEKLSIETYLWTQTICYIITFLLALYVLLYKIGLPKIKWNFHFNRLVLKKSFPYALLIVLMMLYNRIDAVMLERIAGKFEAGIYSQAYRILDGLFMFASLFASLLFPIFSNSFAKKLNIIPLLKSSSNLLIGGAIIVASTFVLHANFLLSLIYKHHISESIGVLNFLMWSFVPICIIIIHGTLLTAKGNLTFLAVISVIGIFLNIALNLYFIPKKGASGAAVATLITQSFIAISQLIYNIKELKLNLKFFKPLSYLGLFVFVLLIEYLHPNVEKNIVYLFAPTLLLIIYCFASNLFEWKSILTFISKEN